MTRINAGVSPGELHRLHIIAEYRELPMVAASLRRSLRTKSIEDVLKNIPRNFTLNSGHVLFFYNKMNYLLGRYHDLQVEMRIRGYSPSGTRNHLMSGLPPACYGSWTATPEARSLVLERIALRKSEKPHLYN